MLAKKRQNNTGIQTTRVIVDVHREQASLLRGVHQPVKSTTDSHHSFHRYSSLKNASSVFLS